MRKLLIRLKKTNSVFQYSPRNRWAPLTVDMITKSRSHIGWLSPHVRPRTKDKGCQNGPKKWDAGMAPTTGQAQEIG